jgi:hypothetical protein
MITGRGCAVHPGQAVHVRGVREGGGNEAAGDAIYASVTGSGQIRRSVFEKYSCFAGFDRGGAVHPSGSHFVRGLLRK